MVSTLEFQTASAELVTLMQGQLLDLLSPFGPDTDPARVRDVLLGAFPDFMTAYGDTAAVLAGDFYDEAANMAVSSARLATTFAEPANTAQSEGVVRWAVGPLFDEEPNWDSFQSSLMGASQRLVAQPARQTIDLRAKSDAQAGTFDAVSWSRQTHPERAKSHESCEFCVMLAGRGPVYRSSAAAGAAIGRGVDPSQAFSADGKRKASWLGQGVKARGARSLSSDYHDDCHCVPVPTFYRRQQWTHSVRGYERTEWALFPITD